MTGLDMILPKARAAQPRTAKMRFHERENARRARAHKHFAAMAEERANHLLEGHAERVSQRTNESEGYANRLLNGDRSVSQGSKIAQATGTSLTADALLAMMR